SEQACLDLKTQIEGGDTSFESAAAEHSQCPSGKQGGDLGTFGPGMMVPEFDRVVFNEDVGKVHGPIQTQFGYHLVEITHRES
ncbi:MAG: peptidylprolyl isomerase, partial [Arenicella sp.]|nr:peptidylprolyl isomerase [Arenicella sp.]